MMKDGIGKKLVLAQLPAVQRSQAAVQLPDVGQVFFYVLNRNSPQISGIVGDAV